VTRPGAIIEIYGRYGRRQKQWKFKQSMGENAQGSAVSTLYISMYLEKRLAGKFDI
jgi:hypothetical protein